MKYLKLFESFNNQKELDKVNSIFIYFVVNSILEKETTKSKTIKGRWQYKIKNQKNRFFKNLFTEPILTISMERSESTKTKRLEAKFGDFLIDKIEEQIGPPEMNYTSQIYFYTKLFESLTKYVKNNYPGIRSFCYETSTGLGLIFAEVVDNMGFESRTIYE
jgi:hypothetical protein